MFILVPYRMISRKNTGSSVNQFFALHYFKVSLGKGALGLGRVHLGRRFRTPREREGDRGTGREHDERSQDASHQAPGLVQHAG